jgi:hypothetical protein
MTEQKKKKSTKEKLKANWDEVESTINLVKSQGKIQGAEFAINHFQTYKKIIYLSLCAILLYNLLNANWLMSLFYFGLLHMHIMVNRNYWEIKTLQAYLEENAQRNN